MEKYKIKQNGASFSEEEISQQKNFQKFVADYKKQASPFSKGKITIAILSTAVLVSVLVLYINKKSGSTNDTNVTSENKSAFVAPPLKGIDIPYDQFTVDGSTGSELKYKTGSVIHVPSNAFLDRDDNMVSGNITLRYREFHDPADIFISGIPMTYDSAGAQYHFESAGMMELLAFKGNEPLKINPQALITVEMASYEPGDYFNVYYLDTAKRNWSFVERDTAGNPPVNYSQIDSLLKISSPEKIEKKLNADISQMGKEIAANEKNRPMEPRKVNKDRYQVKIDVKPEEFPEITMYKDVLFEISPLEKNFKPEYANQTWEKVIVEHGKGKEDYILTFSKGRTQKSFLCGPVLDGANYTDARNIFEKLFDTYASYRDERKKKKLEKEQQLQFLHDKLKGTYDALNDSTNGMNASQSAVYEKEMAVKRVFEVSNFGIWNCDCPTALPKGMLVNAKFVDSTGKPIKCEHAYLVQKGKNALFTYYSYAFNAFQYNPKMQNMVWAVTEGNKFAWFPVERFSKLKTVGDSTVFEMKVANKKFSNSMEVKLFMKI